MKLQLIAKHALKDRAFVIPLLGLLLASLVIVIVFATQIKPSQLNLPIRYTTFGVTHVYNDSWYYLLGFILFIVASFIIHSLIALKLFSQKGPVIARLFLTLSIMLVVIEYFFIISVLGIALLSQ